MNSSQNKQKPWLNYHKDGAPVREYSAKKKTPRDLIYARVWLILVGYIGAHRFYLWKPKTGVIFVIFYLSISLIWASFQDESLSSKFATIAFLAIWLGVISVEWRRLPKMVEDANNAKWLRGKDSHEKIGSFEKLRLNGIIAVVSLCITFLMGLFFPDSNLTLLSFLVYFFAVAVFVIRFILIDQRRKTGSQND